jgi:hypothetical protein
LVFLLFTVIFVRPKTGESAQISFASKFEGEFFDLCEFHPLSSQKFADLGEIRPNRQNFARKFLEQKLIAWIRPFQTNFAHSRQVSPIPEKFRSKKIIVLVRSITMIYHQKFQEYMPTRLDPNKSVKIQNSYQAGAFLYGKIVNSKNDESCGLKNCGHSLGTTFVRASASKIEIWPKNSKF